MGVKDIAFYSAVAASGMAASVQATEAESEFARVNGEPFIITIPTHLDPEIAEHCATQYSTVKLQVAPIEIGYFDTPSNLRTDYKVHGVIGNLNYLKDDYIGNTEAEIQEHANKFTEAADGIANTQKPISVSFDSPGGQVITANKITAAVLEAQHNGHPVSTITYSVSSAAIDPFIAGTEGRRTISYDYTDNKNVFHQSSVDWGTGRGREFTSDWQEFLDSGKGNFLSRHFIKGMIVDNMEKREGDINFYIDNSTTHITYECAETLSSEIDKNLATRDMLAFGFADYAILTGPTKEKLVDLGMLEEDADRIINMSINGELENGVVIYRASEQNPLTESPTYTTLLETDDVNPYVTPEGLDIVEGVTTSSGAPLYSKQFKP